MARRIASRDLRPRDAASFIVAVWVFWILIFAVVEHLVDSQTFGSVWDGIWWGTQTITTVGYGDIVPHDAIGKVMGVVLMLGGLSLVAVLTGAITSGFVTQAQAERHQPGNDPVMQKLQEVLDQLEQLNATLSDRRPGEPD